MKLLHHIEQELFERGVSGSLSNLLVDIAEEAEPTHDAEGAEESPPRFGEPAAFEREAIASPPPSASPSCSCDAAVGWHPDQVAMRSQQAATCAPPLRFEVKVEH